MPKLKDREEKPLFAAETVLKYERPDRAYIANVLRRVLKGITADELAKWLTTPARDAFEYLQLMQNGHTCQRMSLRYNPHRLATRANTAKTVIEALGEDNFYSGLARVWLADMYNNALPDVLYNMLQAGVNGLQYVNEFPPHVARDIYRHYGIDRRSRILDPCAGWGGRMIGASVVSNHYTGFEPAFQTFVGLEYLARDLNEWTGSFEAHVYCKPFEDANLRPNHFDIALTSPPYYDTEKYSEDDGQSYIRYKTFDKWVIGFYLPFIDKTMAALKPGAPFILNIGDRKYPLPSVMREHCAKIGVKVERMPMRLSNGGGLRNKEKGEGEVFFVLTKEN